VIASLCGSYCALFAEWIDVGALEARVESADGGFFVEFEGLGEIAALDAQVGAEDVVDW